MIYSTGTWSDISKLCGFGESKLECLSLARFFIPGQTSESDRIYLPKLDVFATNALAYYAVESI